MTYRFNNKPMYTLDHWIYTGRYSRASGFSVYTSTINLSPITTIDIPEDSKLYFDKSAVFPRFKIQATNYKRVIKQEKADFVIIGNIEFIPSNYQQYIADCGTCYYTSRTQNLTPEQFINKVKMKMNSENVNLIYTGYLTLLDLTSDNAYQNIVNGNYKNYIIDTDFDKYINSKFGEPSMNDVNSIFDLFMSQDKSSVKLGMELLGGINITAAPKTFYILLSMFYGKLKSCCDLNSVTNKRIMQTINPTHVNPDYTTCVRLWKRDYPTTELDREFCKNIVNKLSVAYMNKIIRNLNTEINELGLSASYEIV